MPVLYFPSAYDQFDTAVRLYSQGLGIQFMSYKVTVKIIVSAVRKMNTGHYKEQVREVSHLLKAGGGAKIGTDLVALYPNVGYDHSIPSFVHYKSGYSTIILMCRSLVFVTCLVLKRYVVFVLNVVIKKRNKTKIIHNLK